MRLEIVDGFLVWTRVDGTTETLCRSSEVRRIVHLNEPDPRWLIGTSGRAWALPDGGWSPGWFGASAVGRRHNASNAVAALASTIGVTPTYVGGRPGASPAGEGVPITVIDPRPRRPAVLRVLCILSLVAWLIGLPALVLDAMVTHLLDDIAAATVAGLVFVAPLCWVGAAGVSALASLPSIRRARPPAVPEAAVAWRPEPAGDATRAFLADALMIIGRGEVLVRSASGAEAWLPGPSRGGIGRAIITGRQSDADRQLLLCRDEANPWVTLPLADWAGSTEQLARLTDALQRAGIAVGQEPDRPRERVYAGLVAEPSWDDILRTRVPPVASLDVVLPGALCLLAEVFLLGSGVNALTVLGSVAPLGILTAVLWRRHGPEARRLTRAVPCDEVGSTGRRPGEGASRK